MDKSTLDKLKTIELDMFKIFIDICKKYKLKYYLLGGTALGAVRHKGFIPWDDDIDVGMPRKDYEKFLKVAQSELPKHLFLQTHITDKNFPLNFAKIRNSNTTFIQEVLKDIKMNQGVYIDVFPLDGYPDSKLAIKAQKLCDNIIYNSIRRNVYKIKNKKTTLWGYLNDIFTLCFFSDYRKAIKTRDYVFKKYSYDDSKIVANYDGNWGIKEVMPKSYFGNGTIGKFEGIDVVLPEDYDKYLTSLYGDYMTPPPIDKRKPPHYCAIIDTEKSYLYYMDKGE